MRLLLVIALVAASAVAGAPADPPPAAPDTDPLYDTAKQLFDQYAPPEVKAQVDFPTPDQFQDFARQLEQALDGDSLDALSQYRDQGEAFLTVLRALPAYAGYADWLEARLQEVDAARALPPLRPPPPAAGGPEVRPLASGPAIPYYEVWLARERRRSPPANAAELMPRLRAAFAEEHVPPALAWLAEAESSLNPEARNPSGAAGLFQLKAATARGLGLSTFLPDQRTDPELSARAAARQLRALGVHYGSWPLAIAAYNAGEGRVDRTLAATHTHDYAGVASALPAGTRMYVPEVCALMAARAGVSPGQLPAPE